MVASGFKSNVPVPVVRYGSAFPYGTIAAVGDLIRVTQLDIQEHQPLSPGGSYGNQKMARIAGEYQAGITAEYLSEENGYGYTYVGGVYAWRILRPSYYLVHASMFLNILPTTKAMAEDVIEALELKLHVFEGEVEIYSPLKIGLPEMDPHNHGGGGYESFYYPVNNSSPNKFPTPNNSVDRRVLLWGSHKSLFTFKRGDDHDMFMNTPGYTVVTHFYRLCDQQNFLDWKLPDDSEDEDA